MESRVHFEGKWREKKVAEKEKKSLEACNVAKKRLLQAACEETASRPYIEGRFFHVSELVAKLFCRLSKAVLSLTDVIRETRMGMHSILNMKCRACDVLNKINSYGKNSSSKKRKIGFSGYQLKNGTECTSQFFEKNVQTL